LVAEIFTWLSSFQAAIAAGLIFLVKRVLEAAPVAGEGTMVGDRQWWGVELGEVGG
jgi:hypothetical protein